MKERLSIAVLLCCALAMSACGSSNSSSASGGSGGSSSSASVSGAKVLPATALDNPPKGTITYCQGKDTTGIGHDVVASFNAKYGAQGYKAQLVEFPASADQQRSQFIQRQQAKSSSCDVFSSDVIWTAEFSSQHWLYDLTPYVQAQASKYIAAPLETVHYGGKYWGVPETSDAAFLYSKKGSSPPATWQAVYAAAKSSGGIVYQGAPYEGLTCDFLEVAFAAGGQVLSPDGKKSLINSPQNQAALTLMVNGIKSGSAPQSVTTYMEPETDQAWDSGKYGFMRNWTYAYAADNTGSMKGKYAVAPLPSFAGGSRAGILGGHNSVISAYSKDPGLALKFADFYASTAFQTTALIKYSQAAVLPNIYSLPAVTKAVPYAKELLQALSQAHARPVSPVYPQISQAIYKNVNDALAGRVSPAAALKAADSQINAALSTF
ncbi:MAG: trehalose/maltose transport system substrate-binding protein [Solirubrobacteraceae bacterium]|nr:trehalose/maltose transport system substrate-binding protein [Solirubrobacteraceae bacterium]